MLVKKFLPEQGWSCPVERLRDSRTIISELTSPEERVRVQFSSSSTGKSLVCLRNPSPPVKSAENIVRRGPFLRTETVEDNYDDQRCIPTVRSFMVILCNIRCIYLVNKEAVEAPKSIRQRSIQYVSCCSTQLSRFFLSFLD